MEIFHVGNVRKIPKPITCSLGKTELKFYKLRALGW